MAILTLSLAILALYMSALFLVSLVRHNNGIADIGYGIAFIVVISATLLHVDSPSAYAATLSALAFVWGMRLAIRIFRKNYDKPEDFRYKAWRDAWGKSFIIRSFLQVYMLQGLVVFIVALPITLSLVFPTSEPSRTLFAIGVAIWCIGFFFEAVGDYQLDRFLKNPATKGTIMTTGLWKYSRHPNYFGESTMWVGIAIAASGLSTLPLLGFVSPFLITFLLLKVSGVPLLEKRFEGNPAWEAYKSRTSVFVPLPPRADS